MKTGGAMEMMRAIKDYDYDISLQELIDAKITKLSDVDYMRLLEVIRGIMETVEVETEDRDINSIRLVNTAKLCKMYVELALDAWRCPHV